MKHKIRKTEIGDYEYRGRIIRKINNRSNAYARFKVGTYSFTKLSEAKIYIDKSAELKEAMISQ